jgi:hypothetical protein
MMKTVKENKIKADDVKEIKVEVIARAADILGDPRDPMTEDEIAVKFTALGGNVVGKDQCKKLQKFHYEHRGRREA